MGPEDSRGFDPFHSKLKVHVEEEEMSKDGRRESILPECTVEDDPVLGRPKSQGKEGTTSPEAIPLRIPKEIPSPIG